MSESAVDAEIPTATAQLRVSASSAAHQIIGDAPHELANRSRDPGQRRCHLGPRRRDLGDSFHGCGQTCLGGRDAPQITTDSLRTAVSDWPLCARSSTSRRNGHAPLGRRGREQPTLSGEVIRAQVFADDIDGASRAGDSDLGSVDQGVGIRPVSRQSRPAWMRSVLNPSSRRWCRTRPAPTAASRASAA